RLEAVEVDIEHARDLAPAAIGEMLGELALELLAIRDVGEGVVRRRPRQRIALAALFADVAERPDRPLAGVVRAHRRAEQVAPEAAAVAADELDLFREHAAHAERGADTGAEALVELVGGVDHARHHAVEAGSFVAEQAVELVADQLEAAVARERDA